MTPRSSRLRPFAALAVGIVVFAAGVALARAWLPEWLSGDLPEKRFFVERYRELARRGGVRLPQAEPWLGFAGRDDEVKLDGRVLDRMDPAQAAGMGAGLLVEVKQAAAPAGTGTRTKEFLIRFLPSGEPLFVRLGHSAEIVRDSIREKEPPPSAAEQARFSALLLRTGERFGTAGRGKVEQPEGVKFNDKGVVVGATYPVIGSAPPQNVTVTAAPGGALVLLRKPSEAAKEDDDDNLPVADILLGLPVVAGFIAVFVLFFVLLGRRRIDLVNGLLLGAVVLAAATVGTLGRDFSWLGALQILGAAFLALWAFLVWSTGESFLRSVHPGLTTGLDALRTGRLGPRGGSALLYGVAGGAALAGLRLAAHGLASRLPGFWADESSIELPLFGAQTPFNHGAVLAGGIALAMGIASRFLPARWWPWAAALAGGLAVPFVSIDPSWFQALAGVAAGGILVLISLRAGLAAGLVAALSAFLLQAAAFAAMHISWLPFSFAVSAGVPALFLVLGLVGLRRPAQAEIERVEPPAFMKRLEEERRLKYEMDLLARMQLGLLPEKLPEVEGWEIAARSLLATEAGGDLYDFLPDEKGHLWIAAGDVAGHGYSCSIAHAMTSAALASLVGGEKTPGDVLVETDRVIRRGRQRNFTSLALVRLEPRTGEAWMSNAGHPFPLLLLGAAGGVEEIDLPGLPLGQGPPRKYSNLQFNVSPGSSLVLCSDGLFEAADARETLYGYDRPRDLLHSLGDRSAAEILEALFADWRRHLAGREHQDDTTVVVLKRL